MNDKPQIDIVVLDEGSRSERSNPEHLHAEYSIAGVLQIVEGLLHGDGYVFFIGSGLPCPELDLLGRLTERNVDIWHGGLKLGTEEEPELLDCVSPISYFNINAGSHQENTSWRISLRCCLVKKQVLRSFPFLDKRFKSLDAAVLEWGYRLIWKGVFIRYTPLLIHEQENATTVIPQEDQLRFIYYRFGRQWLLWSAVCQACAGFSFAPIRWATRIVKEQPISSEERAKFPAWVTHPIPAEATRVTVLIPTVERYPYLEKLLSQLQEQTFLPFEVIVIDQTPREQRRHDIASDFPRLNIKWLELDQSGQCNSRNTGLLQSRGDCILFLDDDDEVKPDLIEKHLRCLNYFQVDISCGVCDEAGAGPVPQDYSFIRLSDVFPTNNSLVRRNILQQSGLFDMAFDRGQKADGDLGARIYATGAMMLLNPEIRVFHHHAPRGGLRKHNVRKVTYSSSRKFITHFRLPHITELYFNERYFTERQQRFYKYLVILGTFSIRGSMPKKILKFFYAVIMLPFNWWKIRKRCALAAEMMKKYPNFPELSH